MQKNIGMLLIVFILLATSLMAKEETVQGRSESFTLQATQSDSEPDAHSQTDAIPGNQRNIVRTILSDFRNLFTTRENLYIAAAGIGGAYAANSRDKEISQSHFNSELNENTLQDHVFDPGEIIGDGIVQAGCAAAVFGIGKISHHSGLEDIGRDLVRAQALSLTITQAIKYGTQRVRPDGSDHLSMPSGHTSSAFATAAVIQRRYGWKMAIASYGMASYVAASRLTENKHYLSDVIVGATIGIIAGRTATFGRRRSRIALFPTSLSGGGWGIQMRLLSK